jgi:hypothetical protein
MRIVNQIDAAILAKMQELKAVVAARQRMEDRAFAVEQGEDKTFWKKGHVSTRIKTNVIRRREVK